MRNRKKTSDGSCAQLFQTHLRNFTRRSTCDPRQHTSIVVHEPRRYASKVRDDRFHWIAIKKNPGNAGPDPCDARDLRETTTGELHEEVLFTSGSSLAQSLD